MRIKIEQKWMEKLRLIPESGMGYQKVDITLKEGTEIKDVFIYNGEELDLPEKYSSIKIIEIVKIILHKKDE